MVRGDSMELGRGQECCGWDAAWVLQGGRTVWGCLDRLTQTFPHHEVGAWVRRTKVSLLKVMLPVLESPIGGAVGSAPSLPRGEGPASGPRVHGAWGGPGATITGLWLSPHP